MIRYFFFWILINSSWSNIFCPGFESSQVDPIFFCWILINSSWSNIFCTGFGSSRIDPILFFWILIKSSWSNIFWTGFRFWKKLIFLIKIQLFWAFYAFEEIESEWFWRCPEGAPISQCRKCQRSPPNYLYFYSTLKNIFPRYNSHMKN